MTRAHYRTINGNLVKKKSIKMPVTITIDQMTDILCWCLKCRVVTRANNFTLISSDSDRPVRILISED